MHAPIAFLLGIALMLSGCGTRPAPREPPAEPLTTALPPGFLPPAAIPSSPSSSSPSPGASAEPEPRSPGTACPDSAFAPLVEMTQPLTFGSFVEALSRQLDSLELSSLRPEYERFVARRKLPADPPGLFQEFARLWVLFETTRDGGSWRLRWDITNQNPSIRTIWRTWTKGEVLEAFAKPSATAECDELSALFALMARRVGVRGVGLFYPTWNHTIAAWAPAPLPRKSTPLVLIPTTQIYLGCEDSFDQTSFVTRLTTIEEYPRWDVRDASPMPESLGRFLLEQVRVYGGASPTLTALLRARRAIAFGSSMGSCIEYRTGLAQQLREKLTCIDQSALRYFAEHELKKPEVTTEQLLAWLSAP